MTNSAEKLLAKDRGNALSSTFVWSPQLGFRAYPLLVITSQLRKYETVPHSNFQIDVPLRRTFVWGLKSSGAGLESAHVAEPPLVALEVSHVRPQVFDLRLALDVRAISCKDGVVPSSHTPAIWPEILLHETQMGVSGRTSACRREQAAANHA